MRARSRKAVALAALLTALTAMFTAALPTFAAESAFGLPVLPAAEVALVGLRGERLAEGDLAHGATIAVFFASWSPRSRDLVERVNPLATHWSGRARVVVVDFEEERPAIESFLAGKAVSAPVFLDPEGALAKRYGIATLPALLVLKEGQVAYHGKLPDNPEALLQSLLP
jgi:thiol-disulfide isomerase/thioredoxin